MFKHFVDKDAKQTVAINQNHVKYVRETDYGTKVIFIDGSYIVVDTNYLETVARLLEKK
jgi:hypothetical protein